MVRLVSSTIQTPIEIAFVILNGWRALEIKRIGERETDFLPGFYNIGVSTDRIEAGIEILW